MRRSRVRISVGPFWWSEIVFNSENIEISWEYPRTEWSRTFLRIEKDHIGAHIGKQKEKKCYFKNWWYFCIHWNDHSKLKNEIGVFKQFCIHLVCKRVRTFRWIWIFLPFIWILREYGFKRCKGSPFLSLVRLSTTPEQAPEATLGPATEPTPAPTPEPKPELTPEPTPETTPTPALPPPKPVTTTLPYYDYVTHPFDPDIGEIDEHLRIHSFKLI